MLLDIFPLQETLKNRRYICIVDLNFHSTINQLQKIVNYQKKKVYPA